MSRLPRARLATVLVWSTAGILHFVMPKPYEGIVPHSIERWKREAVFWSGVAELGGGLAVFPETTRRGARWWLLATLAAVYPANVQMALHPERYPQIPAAVLWARLPFQFAFAALTWRGTR